MKHRIWSILFYIYVLCNDKWYTARLPIYILIFFFYSHRPTNTATERDAPKPTIVICDTPSPAISVITISSDSDEENDPVIMYVFSGIFHYEIISQQSNSFGLLLYSKVKRMKLLK